MTYTLEHAGGQRVVLDNYALAGEDDKEMAIGWSASGALLEIIYLVLDDDRITAIHAMRCRKKYLRVDL